MDPNTHHHDPSHQNVVPATPSSSRKRSRENETPSQRHKREKAAERQRRKRERDRQAGLNTILALSQVQPGPLKWSPRYKYRRASPSTKVTIPPPRML
ncbi:hypothetical protein A0H81_10895 [Grifola frondosa]|uniref:Uncharacterized protein n=1 Tax=Grifola frondosa TaxID=5627 RepID=A0A1C7LWT9_GRIFR|nr:hypothetical protein A0H81_10895 [Grifola frondosa]